MKERKFGRYLAVWLCISLLLFSPLYAFLIYMDQLGYESKLLSEFYIKMCNPNVSSDGGYLVDYGFFTDTGTNAQVIDAMVDPDDKVLEFSIYNKLDKFLIKATRDLALFRSYNLGIMGRNNVCDLDYDLYYLNGSLDRIELHGTYSTIYKEDMESGTIKLDDNSREFFLDYYYMTRNSAKISYDFIEEKKDLLFPGDMNAIGVKADKYAMELLYKDEAVPFQILFSYPNSDRLPQYDYELAKERSTYIFRKGDYLISFCTDVYDSVAVEKVNVARIVPYLEAESSYCMVAAGVIYSVALVIGILFAVIRYRRYKHVYELITYRNNLTDNLAHNFKTPLQIISGYAENIGDTDSPEDLKRYSEAITDKVAKMNESIESILLAAKRVEKKAVRNDVGEIIGEVSSNLDNMSRVKLVVEGSAVIRCDRLILTNILTNLLDNASRYAPEGSEVKVSLKGRRVTVTNPVKNEMFVPGIGLTVATRMAENIRMTLTMKNDGKLFTAVLK